MNDFFVSIDFLLSNQNQNNPILNGNNSALNTLSLKPMFHQTLFEFSKFLMLRFFAPKTLKELCRFKLRQEMFDRIKLDKLKYSHAFTKKDHCELILNTFKLPCNLLSYLMHSD